MPGKDNGKSEGTLQPVQGLLYRLDRIQPLLEVMSHEMHDRLPIGRGHEAVALRFLFGAQIPVVLDNTVMHQSQAAVRMGMCARLGCPRTRRQTGMADAGNSPKRLLLQPLDQPLDLSGGSLAFDDAIDQ